MVADGPKWRQAAIAFAPFFGVSLVAWTVVLVGSRVDWTEYALAWGIGLLAAGLFARTIVGWRAGPLPSALAFLAAAALLRDATGGIASGVGILVIIPSFATALHCRLRRHLAAILVADILFWVVPILVVGGTAYPDSQYRTGLFSLLTCALVGLTTQRLVGRLRSQAEDARERERMLVAVSASVSRLFDSTDPCDDVCEAARDISGASVALLYQPREDGRLACSAMTDGVRGDREVLAAPASAVVQAFTAGTPQMLATPTPDQVGSIELWRASGSPISILYHPLRRGERTLGVLVVGWPEAVSANGGRAHVVALLAHEVAAVLARAEALDSLTDAVHTDPLTGLQNRRAWEEALADAVGSGRSLAVAMLDLDHFKAFNDTFGHPAGDRLLKATTAAWRDEIRAGDVLARLGGEEFGLLLRDRDVDGAQEVIERLRARVAANCTCSAGIAARRSDETGAEVLARADIALYAAKAQGRDRAALAA